MLKLLERHIASLERRLVLLAPPHRPIPDTFTNVIVDSRQRQGLIREMQRLRGTVYLSDGAVRPHHLSAGGLHQTPEDEKSWHLLMTDGKGRVSSCAWYLDHDDARSIDNLRVRTCPLRQVDQWRDVVERAVDSEIARARQDGLHYAELGGWAISEEHRGTPEGLMTALATYSLSRILGGALGITTATVRHCSSTILRKFGGSNLEFDGTAVPSYWDSRYECEMELLRFDSRMPRMKYSGLIELVMSAFSRVSVVAKPKREESSGRAYVERQQPLCAA